MKNIIKIAFLVTLLQHTSYGKANDEPRNLLMVPPGGISETAVTLLWDKTYADSAIVSYEIFRNGKKIANTVKSNFEVRNLIASTSHTFWIVAINKAGHSSFKSNRIKIKTKSKSKLLNVLAFGANGNGVFNNTKAIQNAIDQCKQGETVYIPAGIFISGALYLKSNMILLLAKGAVLKGSKNIADYYPYLLNRFEGWEMKTFASLLNGGKLDSKGGYHIQNVAIKGEGTISGGGEELASAMIKAGGKRARGRLICLMNAKDVIIKGLNIEESPSWTIHYIYSSRVTCQDLKISSKVENGDGIDPDSSSDCYIFNCSFDTDDDCIAIKSGKNPEGNLIAKPTNNINISECDFIKGHGISIGSEISGGIKNINIRNCRAGNLLYGMQIKGTKERGGFVENVVVENCELRKITVFSSLPYNNDGEAAAHPPIFKNFLFANIDMMKGDVKNPLIHLDGFEKENRTTNVQFKNIKLPSGSLVTINNCRDIAFMFAASSGTKPIFSISNSSNINR